MNFHFQIILSIKEEYSGGTIIFGKMIDRSINLLEIRRLKNHFSYRANWSLVISFTRTCLALIINSCQLVPSLRPTV